MMEIVFQQAYIDSSVIIAQAGDFKDESRKCGNIQCMKCSPQNNFFPDLENTSRSSRYYLLLLSQQSHWSCSNMEAIKETCGFC
jgi:hypothetical protein